MSGGGAGDRPGHELALRASDGRHARLHAAQAALHNLSGVRIASVTIVVDELVPQVIMFEGEPFLFDRLSGATLSYLQTRPYRADALVVEEPGR